MVHERKGRLSGRTKHKIAEEVVHEEKGWQRLGYIFWSWKDESGMLAK